jgi:hypothetical protein
MKNNRLLILIAILLGLCLIAPFFFLPHASAITINKPVSSGSSSGSEWLFGSGTPSPSLGKNNDAYLDESTNNVYKKIAGTWSLSTNIKGDAGANGANGANGADGVSGSSGKNVYSGTEAPPAETFGYQNELYLNSSTYELYKKNDATYGSDLASGGTATAINTGWGSPAQVFDNSNSSYWNSSTGTSGANIWIKYDFGEGVAHSFQKVRVLRSCRLKNIRIEGSNNDSDWTVLHYEELANTISEVWTEFEFENSTDYRYFRFYVVDCYAITNAVSLKEIELLEIDTIDWQSIGNLKGGSGGAELSADPDNPAEGNWSMWMSDGTGSGDDGDIMMKITAGGSTKTVTLIDFSAE